MFFQPNESRLFFFPQYYPLHDCLMQSRNVSAIRRKTLIAAAKHFQGSQQVETGIEYRVRLILQKSDSNTKGEVPNNIHLKLVQALKDCARKSQRNRG